jgi:muramoyltetrapeptide carboxypeptidase
LEERPGALGVPVLYKLPFGHGAHLATVPLEVQATLDAGACSLVVTEPALRPARAR